MELWKIQTGLQKEFLTCFSKTIIDKIFRKLCKEIKFVIKNFEE